MLSLAKRKNHLRRKKAMSYGKSSYSPKAEKAPAKKKKPVAKRARSMPLTGPQAKAAVQALRDDAGRKAYRKKQAAKKKK